MISGWFLDITSKIPMPDSKSSEFNGLIPLLVAGYGRSGTTALMALLGTDSRVAMGRAYPFEARPLSYSAKTALLLARNARESHVPGERFFAYEDCGLSAPPWLPPGSSQPAEGDIGSPPALDWFQQLWELFEKKLSSRMAIGGLLDSSLTTSHSPNWHAEKVAAWVPAFARLALPARTLYLTRDPRDMYLSSNALMRQRNYFSFGRGPADSDLDHARNLTYEILLYFENYRADRERSDCLLIPYTDLVVDLDGTVDRLQNYAGLRCQAKDMPANLEFHRTSSSPEKSINRWRQEPLPKGVMRFLETYLQECFVAFQYEFTNNPRICPGVDFAKHKSSGDLAQPKAHPSPIDDENGPRLTLGHGKTKVDLPIDPFEARIFTEVWLSVYGPGLDQVSLLWQTMNGDFTANCKLSQSWYTACHWRVIRFAVGRQESWQGRITGLRLELTAGPTSKSGDDAFVRWVRLVE
jgi:hypothetical protein